MTFNFTPDNNKTAIEVPFLEDARSDFAPYWGEMNNKPTDKKIRDAQNQVSIEMAKLGGSPFKFVEGVFEQNNVRRYGFEIHFMYGGGQGIIKAAGLPIRSETETRIKAVKIQALKVVRDWLKSAVTAKIFSPGHDPLLGHMLLPDGSTTINEYIHSRGDLPMLEDRTNDTRIETP